MDLSMDPVEPTESNEEYWMQYALEDAARALADDELPVGAVVVLEDRIVGAGRRFSGGNFRMDHAEVLALRMALDRGHAHRAAELTVFTTLEPCLQCYGTLLNAMVGRIVYALHDPYGGATGIPAHALPVRHRNRLPVIVSGVRREEVRELFGRYFRTTRNPFWRTAHDNPLYRLCVS